MQTRFSELMEQLQQHNCSLIINPCCAKPLAFSVTVKHNKTGKEVEQLAPQRFMETDWVVFAADYCIKQLIK